MVYDSISSQIILTHFSPETRPRGYKKLCSTQLNIKLFLLINVKMPTIVNFNIYEQEK